MFRTFTILAVIVNSILATDYILHLDPDLYVPCIDGPPGSMGLREAYNMDNALVEMDEDGLHLSGNVTTVWNIAPTDRISARVNLMQYDRGTWQPTAINMHAPDFCSVMFNKNQYWFKYWFQYFANREEMREKCIATKDTVLVYTPFTFNLRFDNVIGPPFRGRYKLVITFEPFDENNIKRPYSVCFEVRGEIEKIRK
ncbi:uncharacterized protein [Drosophila takahashii]|uniref:uncharacterized protein n=1 Tax=Drosophila takahashii TaxID=29030 RepID=UPI001CF91739|nr:uncharacterized protein LOC108069084 [Drosophila takahashii]